MKCPKCNIGNLYVNTLSCEDDADTTYIECKQCKSSFGRIDFEDVVEILIENNLITFGKDGRWKNENPKG